MQNIITREQILAAHAQIYGEEIHDDTHWITHVLFVVTLMAVGALNGFLGFWVIAHNFL